MNKNFGVSVLILCFGLSSVDAALADQIVEIPPIIVQPYDLREISQQMIAQDRVNRDQELAIKGLMDDNQKLATTALAEQQDATLEKVNQTMMKYRDYLLSRDQARVAVSSQSGHRYDDLIKLTEDADHMTTAQYTLQLKSDVIQEKYKILTDLKNEMTTLNEKLKAEEVNKNFKTISSQQEEKIRLLTQRLAEMDQRISHYDGILAEKDQQISQLKSNLASVQDEAAAKDKMIKDQENQISVLQGQSQTLSTKEELIKSQADQMAGTLEQYKNKGVEYDDIRAEAIALRNKVVEQGTDLKAKNDSINWLNQVLSASKNKTEYYKLTSQQAQLSLKQVQEEVKNIKDDFAQHFKDYDQMESSIVSLKSQVSQLGTQLSQKQSQVDLLKSELENKITEADSQSQQEEKTQQGLKAQLQDKQDQIAKMQSDIKEILQDRANKEIYEHNAALQRDDRVNLAKELIDLQQQEAALLDEKGNLEAAQNTLFDQHVFSLQNKISALLVNHHIQTQDLQSRMDELQNELGQKEQQAGLLKTELENKISQEKDQAVLAAEIQDLKFQLQDKENQIASMKATVQSGQETQAQTETLRQQVVDQQNKIDQLKQELDSKNTQFDQMSKIVQDYQKKLESKDNAYNEELKQVLAYKNAQALSEAQIADLNARLQEKEGQVVKIKKDMYDLQESANAKDMDVQTKDLSLSMMQQKAMDDKINEYQNKINGLQATTGRQVEEIRGLKTELALARQQLQGVPSSDEMEFLKTGLSKATTQLAQKDAMISQIKANADEYEKEFKQQSQEFQSLKDQLKDAQDEISDKKEDLKYKDMEITRLKVHSRMGGSDLQKEVTLLTQKLEIAEKRLRSKTHVDKAEALQAQLANANAEIKSLRDQLNQFIVPSKNSPMEEKLKQAVEKVDEQGRVINVLVQKLQESGQSVDLTKDIGK